MTRARVYVASKAEHGPLWRELRAAGEPIISTWIDESGPGQTADWPGLWWRCIQEASTATALVCYCREGERPLKGALVEVGAALAHGVPVYWVGPEQSVTRHPLVTVCLTLLDALNQAAVYQSDPGQERPLVDLGTREVARRVQFVEATEERRRRERGRAHVRGGRTMTDLNFTDAPICPWCGHIRDAWELGLEDGDTTEVDCGECGKQYRVTASVNISYSTQPWTALDEVKERLAKAGGREWSARRMAAANLRWGRNESLAQVWFDVAARLNDDTLRLEQEVADLEAQGA